ncbi:MAG TPA: hypothetical protein VI997_07010 [Candidatus Thermoplasmatota archaeon]|nr:hypothetical protein [Candidatus Thermoplasmatota archaeon]
MTYHIACMACEILLADEKIDALVSKAVHHRGRCDGAQFEARGEAAVETPRGVGVLFGAPAPRLG